MHKALEDNKISQKLMDPSVTISDYAFYLRCMSEVIKNFDEKVLPAISEVITDSDQRKKMADINTDLEFLYNHGAENKPAASFEGFTGNESLAYALGYAYVVEGSTLGGRVILKQIAQVLPMDGGTRFFEGYGAETGSFWKNFMMHFTRYVLTTNTGEEAIKGAIDGFSHIGQHFAKHD